MPRSAREIVRTAVGLAALAPAVGLLALSVILFSDGGARGAAAGLFVGLLAVGLLIVALMMTYAPVTIGKLLGRGNDGNGDDAEGASPGTNGGPRVRVFRDRDEGNGEGDRPEQP